jgi:hypothetical protein
MPDAMTDALSVPVQTSLPDLSHRRSLGLPGVGFSRFRLFGREGSSREPDWPCAGCRSLHAGRNHRQASLESDRRLDQGKSTEEPRGPTAGPRKRAKALPALLEIAVVVKARRSRRQQHHRPRPGQLASARHGLR